MSTDLSKLMNTATEELSLTTLELVVELTAYGVRAKLVADGDDWICETGSDVDSTVDILIDAARRDLDPQASTTTDFDRFERLGWKLAAEDEERRHAAEWAHRNRFAVPDGF